MYVGYLMLRNAIDEPNTRARMSAVLSIFACIDIVIVWKSIEWWRTQHPGPVLSIRSGGGMAPGMEAPLWYNLIALLMLSAVLILIRMRQQSMQREIDSLRRYAHAFYNEDTFRNGPTGKPTPSCSMASPSPGW